MTEVERYAGSVVEWAIASPAKLPRPPAASWRGSGRPRTSAVPSETEMDVVTEVISTAAPVLFWSVPLVSIDHRSSPSEVAEKPAVQTTSPVGHGGGAVDVVVAAVVEVVEAGWSPRAVVVVARVVLVVDASPGSVVVVVVTSSSPATVVVAVVLVRGTVASVLDSKVVVVRAAAVVRSRAGEGSSAVPAATRRTPAARRTARGRPNASMSGTFVPRRAAA